MLQTAGRCARMPPMLLEAWLEASASCRWTMWAGFHYQGTALKFFPTAEGYVRASEGKSGYVYNYADHQGTNFTMEDVKYYKKNENK